MDRARLWHRCVFRLPFMKFGHLQEQRYLVALELCHKLWTPSTSTVVSVVNLV